MLLKLHTKKARNLHAEVPITTVMRQLFEPDHRWQPARKIIAVAPSQQAKPRLLRNDRSVERDPETLAAHAPLRSTPPSVYQADISGPPASSASSLHIDGGPKPIAHEAAIIAILVRPTPNGELPSHAFHRKEQELRAQFAQLSIVDSLELDRRLSVNAPTDLIARSFSRLVPDRRARLVAFVRDARRREALARSRTG